MTFPILNSSLPYIPKDSFPKWFSHEYLPLVDGIYWKYQYEDIHTLIQSIKFHSLPFLSETVKSYYFSEGKYLCSSLPSESCITYIPLHWISHLLRGYNHTRILASYLESATKIPLRKLFRKNRYHSPLSTRSREDRLSIIVESFTIIAQPPPTVIIVDDIFTTGATLGEISRILRQNGTTSIYALLLARA